MAVRGLNAYKAPAVWYNADSFQFLSTERYEKEGTLR